MEIYNGKYSVYILTNKVNGKMYVGITSKKPNARWEGGQGYKGCPKIWNAIQKYGWDGFDHDIFASNLTQEEACHMEKFLIEKLDTQKKGYNCFEGGQAPKQTEETKEKLRVIHTGKKLPKEWCESISRSKSGANHPYYGKHRPESTRKKIGDANRGRKHSEETRRKFSESHKGKSNHKEVAVVCIETGIIYISMKAAQQETGVSASNIGSVCRGKTKTAGGYHWRYANESLTTIESAS